MDWRFVFLLTKVIIAKVLCGIFGCEGEDK